MGRISDDNQGCDEPKLGVEACWNIVRKLFLGGLKIMLEIVFYIDSRRVKFKPYCLAMYKNNIAPEKDTTCICHR